MFKDKMCKTTVAPSDGLGTTLNNVVYLVILPNSTGELASKWMHWAGHTPISYVLPPLLPPRWFPSV